MTKLDTYRQALRSLPESDWPGYLVKESGLPGPRANLELAAIVRKTNQTADHQSRGGGQRPSVPGDRRENAGDYAKSCEEDSAARWRACLLLVALGQLGLDDLPRLPAPERANRGRIQDERDDQGDHKCDRREDGH